MRMCNCLSFLLQLSDHVFVSLCVCVQHRLYCTVYQRAVGGQGFKKTNNHPLFYYNAPSIPFSLFICPLCLTHTVGYMWTPSLFYRIHTAYVTLNLFYSSLLGRHLTFSSTHRCSFCLSVFLSQWCLLSQLSKVTKCCCCHGALLNVSSRYSHLAECVFVL